MVEVTVNFKLDDEEVKIKCKRNEKMKKIFNKFLDKTKKTDKDLDFFYNDEKIDEDKKLEEINNINKEIIFIVKEKKVNNFLKSSLLPAAAPIMKEKNYSKDIICPICKTSCIIDFKNYKFTKNCLKNHTLKNELIENYYKTQLLNDKKICKECENKVNDLYYNKFYKCFTCNTILCSLCKSNHDDHIIIDYNLINFKCKIHGKSYISYCSNCEKNLCNLCEKEHIKNHKVIDFRELVPNYNVRNKLNDFREKINKLVEDINLIIDKLNYVINNIETYYKINNDIINIYEKKNKNYQIYKNVQNINDYNKSVIKDIEDTLKSANLVDKFVNIFQMYTKMSSNKNNISQSVNKKFKHSETLNIQRPVQITFQRNNTFISNNYNEQDDKNDITLQYKVPNKKGKITLFGNEFVKNNKNKCKLIINDKIKELCQILDLSNCLIVDNILEIKLRIPDFDEITNISSMFSGCVSLFSLPDISKLETKNINKMNHLFNMCESLSSISGISKWDISKVTDISFMFHGCKSLKNLPDISEWDTSNILEMRNLFSGCKSLKNLPDISKWNVLKTNNLSYLFNECYSLKSISDISKWDIKNVVDINHMFNNCFSLESLPDISKWNTSKIKDMIYLFCGCKSLITLPDISKWDISNITNLISIFASCEALEELPDLSKWDTSNIIDMSNMFYNCYGLMSLPDLSKWKTKNVTNMSHMFYYCQSLEEVPNFSKWDISNVKDLSNMFCGCDSLKDFPNISEWNTENVQDMSYMFANCYSLKKLPDISKWKISKETKTEQMFYYSNNGETPTIVKKEKDDCLII